jgi:hypothetical protein
MEDGNPASLDAMLHALCHPYRQRILLAVSDHGPRTGEEFTPDSFGPDDADDVERKRMRTELYHSHLPRLAKLGYVEWDSETGTVRRGPNFEAIDPLVRLLVEHEDELPDDLP